MPPVSPSPVPPPPAPLPTHSNTWLSVLIGGLIIIIALGAAYWIYSMYALKQQPNEASISARDYDAILANAEERLAKNPNDVGALVSKAFALGQKGSASYNAPEYGAQAAAAAQAAIAVNPNNGDSYRALGYAYELQRMYPEAHAAYQKSLEYDPKTALASDAHVYELEGNWEMAKAGYQTALATNEYAYSARLGLARSEAATGDFAAAKADFESVYNGSRDIMQRARAAYAIGMILVGEGDYDLARSYLVLATTFDETYASARFGLGVALYAQAKDDTLEADVRETLLKSSAISLTTAAAFTPVTKGGVVVGEFISDLYVVGDPELHLEALAAAKGALAANASLTGEGKIALGQSFDAIISAVEAGPPFIVTETEPE